MEAILRLPVLFVIPVGVVVVSVRRSVPHRPHALYPPSEQRRSRRCAPRRADIPPARQPRGARLRSMPGAGTGRSQTAADEAAKMEARCRSIVLARFALRL